MQLTKKLKEHLGESYSGFADKDFKEIQEYLKKEQDFK
jgi:hypothetical protein